MHRTANERSRRHQTDRILRNRVHNFSVDSGLHVGFRVFERENFDQRELLLPQLHPKFDDQQFRRKPARKRHVRDAHQQGKQLPNLDGNHRSRRLVLRILRLQKFLAKNLVLQMQKTKNYQLPNRPSHQAKNNSDRRKRGDTSQHEHHRERRSDKKLERSGSKIFIYF